MLLELLLLLLLLVAVVALVLSGRSERRAAQAAKRRAAAEWMLVWVIVASARAVAKERVRASANVAAMVRVDVGSMGRGRGWSSGRQRSAGRAGGSRAAKG